MPQPNSTTPDHPGPRQLALWHLLAMGVDAAIIVAAIVLASQSRLRFGNIPNLSLLLTSAAMALTSTSAAWLALGPLSLNVRLVGASLVLLAALVGATVPLAATGAHAQAVIGMFVAGIAQFLLLQAPYWVLSRWHRLRVVHRDELAGPVERFQYSLRQMLTVMTLVAVVLGIGRGVFWLAVDVQRSRSIVATLFGFFVLLVGHNLLLAWPLIWGTLSPAKGIWRLAAAAALAAVVVASVHPVVLWLLGGQEGPWLYWLLFVPQPLFLLAHLWATRLSGYRLVQGV